MNNRIRRMVDSLLRNSRVGQMYGRVDRTVRPSSRDRADRVSFEPLEVRQLLTAFPVTSTLDDGSVGTLRWAINGVNADSTLDTINFNIGGGGAQTINITSPLPMITNKVNIDGTSQPGYTNKPLIQIDGASLVGNGLLLGLSATNTSAGSTIKGLVITDFGLNGIEVVTSGNTISGNYIGTDGTNQLANGASGVFINGTSATSTGVFLTGSLATTATGNIIGGNTVAARNVISANNLFGVYIGGTNANSNFVEGNYIGTDATGSSKLANASSGVQVESGHNTIGGATATPGQGLGNLISGNGGSGIATNGSKSGSTIIRGNLIGTDATGTTSIENFNAGVLLNSSGNSVGGDLTTYRNIISGNKLFGVYTTGVAALANTIANDYIGTDITGTASVANGTAGVELTTAANIVRSNLISGNTLYGVEVNDAGANSISNNLIGTNAAVTGAVPNGASGVFIDNSGSSTSVSGNTISGNLNGITDMVGGNTFSGNFIGTNSTGASALGNTAAGVVLDGASSDIFGISAVLDSDGKTVDISGTGNVISGNGTDGVLIKNTSKGDATAVIKFDGNYIGTNASGSAAIANANDGIDITSPANVNIGVDTVIGILWGSFDTTSGNTISGNTKNGIEISGASTTGVVIVGNRIGTNSFGTSAVGNGGSGIYINNASGNIIGGTIENAVTEGTPQGGAPDSTVLTSAKQLPNPALKQRNIISGNGTGITITGASAGQNPNYNNYIGLDVSGTSAIPNNIGFHLSGTTGVYVGDQAPTVPVNVISGNTSDGVLIDSGGGNNGVYGDYIGTDYSGFLATNLNSGQNLGNGGAGVDIVNSANNIVGFLTHPDIISGNATGVTISGSGATGNSVVDNSIGLGRALSSHVIVQSSNGTVIANGDSSPSAINGTDFTAVSGPLQQNAATGVYETFYIYNDGISDLSVSGFRIADQTSGVTDFTVTTPSPGTIPAQTYGTFIVYFDTLTAGTINHTLEFTTSDPSKPNYFFNISGTVTGSANPVIPTIPPVTATLPTTATGYSTVENVGNTGDGINITNNASKNTIGSLTGTNYISHNGGNGIHIQGSSTSGNLVQDNYIGTSLSGDTRALITDTTLSRFNDGNALSGVYLDYAPGNFIGGPFPELPNIISRNGGDGITINGGGANGNTIQNNYIGTDKYGVLKLDASKNVLTINDGNTGNGIQIENGAVDNLVGTDTSLANVISSNQQNGVWLNGAQTTGNNVSGNFIGTDSSGSGSSFYGNSLDGVLVGSVANNTIGGLTAKIGTGAGNTISANGGNGISLIGTLAGGNTVEGDSISGNTGAGVYITSPGNHIGIDPTAGSKLSGANSITGVGTDDGILISGSSASNNIITNNSISHESSGIYIDNAPNNTIGDTNGYGNTILLNDNGISINGILATGNTIIGNDIGWVSGSSTSGNKLSGIFIQAPNNIIGGTSAADANVISDNNGDGILVQGITSTGNVIQGNIIGLDITGTVAAGNRSNGIFVVGIPNMTIGGTAAGAGNTVSGNSGAGIYISGVGATGDMIVGNRIGTNINGVPIADSGSTPGTGNRQFGVRLDSAGDQVGGTDPNGDQANIIAGNIKAGVYVFGAAAYNDAILGNSIFQNQIGIELGNGLLNINSVGGTANPSPVVNPNNFQNFPIINYPASGNSTITGYIDTAPNTYYRIELYASQDGEAARLVGSNGSGNVVKTDAAGHATFSIAIGSLNPNEVVTATATRTEATYTKFYDTSEISDLAPTLTGSNSLANVLAYPLVNGETNNGSLVSSLLVASDYDTPTANLGIAVVGVAASANGSYQYSTDNGATWTAFNTASVSPTFATLLSPNSLVRFVPVANFLGAVGATITFKAWDQGNGTVGQTGVDTTHSLVTNSSPSSHTDHFVFSTANFSSSVAVVLATPVVTGYTVDTGTAGDGITSDHNLTFSGTASANFFVKLTLTGPAGPTSATTTVEVPVGNNGIWTWDDSKTTLAKGAYTLTGFAEDIKGTPTYTSSVSNPFNVQIDDLIEISGPGSPGTVVNTGDTTLLPGDGTDFGSTGQNSTTAASGANRIVHTFTITNTGDVNAVINSIHVYDVASYIANSPVDSANFVIEFPVGYNPNLTLPGSTTTFSVSLLTANQGTFTGIVVINYNAPNSNSTTNNPYTYYVGGTVLPSAPQLTGITPDTGTNTTDGVTVAQNISFLGTSPTAGAIVSVFMVGSSGGSPTYTFVNSGTASSTVNSSGSYDWTCSDPSTLAPGTYQFVAQIPGSAYSNAYTVTILPQINAQGYPQGNSTQTPIVSIPTGGVNVPGSADGTDFSSITLDPTDGTAVVHTFTIQNPGNIDLSIDSISLTGSGFSFVGTAPTNITVPANAAFNGTYSFQVQLDTQVIGVKSAVLTINWHNSINATPAPYTFNITGSVIPVAPVITGITVDTSAAQDGTTVDQNIKITGTSDPLATITIYRSDLVGAINTVTVTANLGGQWTFDYTTTTLAPNTAANPHYLFTATQTESGLTSLPSNSFQVTILPSIDVQGNGVDIANGASSPNTNDGTDFGSAIYQTAPVQHTFFILNPGNIDLNVDSVTIPTGFSIVTPLSGPVVINPGGFYALTLQLDTGSLGLPTGNVSIAYHDVIGGSNVGGSYAFKIAGEVDPSAPVFTGITPGSITNGVGFTTAGTITLKGTSAPNCLITVTLVGTGVVGTTNSNNQGIWSYSGTGTTGLSIGSYTYTATATDPNPPITGTGKTSASSAQFTVKVVQSLVVTTASDSTGPGTLRTAITTANAAPGLFYTITFNIPGSGVHVISLNSPLPTITTALRIDGSTQPGFTSSPLVEIDGTNAGQADGLILGVDTVNHTSSMGSTIRGLIISNFSLNGIEVETPNNIIAGNYIGTDGTSKLANHNDGINVNGSGFDSFGNKIAVPAATGNVIGGPYAADMNVISDNNVYGIQIIGDSSTGTVVEGNYIGLTSDGKTALGNASSGVDIESGSNTVTGNVISGNAGSGVGLSGSTGGNNSIVFNLIGTDATGAFAVENVASGVTINSGSNNVSNNVISGNKGNGIFTSGNTAYANSFDGNIVGLDITGSYAIPNRGSGILLTTGDNGISNNLVSGNLGNGVEIQGVIGFTNVASRNSISNNIIGLDGSGSKIVGNKGTGLLIGAGSNANTITGNTISGNGAGIEIDNIHSTYPAPNSGIAKPNEIFGNFIGTDPTGTIALGNLGTGITLNDNVDTMIGTWPEMDAAGKFVEMHGASNTISGNGGDGIVITGASSANYIIDNYIGTATGGLTALGNQGSGINIQDGSGNFIGPIVFNGSLYGNPQYTNSSPIEGEGPNIISGNLKNGIYVTGAKSSGNMIMGNRIGTNPDGTEAIGNTLSGVYIDNAPGNIVGGVVENSPTLGTLSASPASLSTGVAANPIDPQLRQRNVISGNGVGITVHGTAATGSTIVNNYIGLDVTGTLPITVTNDPPAFGTWTTVISSTTSIQVTTLNYPAADYIGRTVTLKNGAGLTHVGKIQSVTAVAGGYVFLLNIVVDPTYNLYQVALTFGNKIAGIELDGAVGNTIGGVGLLHNVVSANQDGFLITGGASGNTITGNYVGLDYTGVYDTDSTARFALGNTGSGVSITNGSNNTVTGNFIGGNGTGVSISGTSSSNTVTGNRVGESVDLTATVVVRGVDENPFVDNTITNQITINSGQTPPIVGNPTDFTANPGDPAHASIVEFGKGVTRNFYIYNDGVAALTIGAFTFPTQQKNADGSLVPTHFTIVEDFTNRTLNPGEVVEFQVYFDSNSAGTFTHTIEFTTTDPNRPKFDLVVTGTVVAPNPLPVPTPPNYPIPTLTTSTPVSFITGGSTTSTASVQDVGNYGDGVYMYGGATNNSILGNTLSHNAGNGVHLKDTITTGNIVQGNYIGLDHTGDIVAANSALVPGTKVTYESKAQAFLYAHLESNALNGVLIESSANNTIGGKAASDRNYISDNLGDGVNITGGGADGNILQGNYIGLDGLGVAKIDKTATSEFLLSLVGIGNHGNGIHITNGATNNIIGGSTLDGSANYISSNDVNGVWMDGVSTTGNQVQGNLIGTDAVGMGDVFSNEFALIDFYQAGGSYGNVADGVLVDNVANNIIGGAADGQGNYIDDNGGNGIHLKGSGTGGNSVFGNQIGVSFTGNFSAGNGGSGVYIESANNLIGGLLKGESNFITNNGASGIYLYSTGAFGNQIYANSISGVVGAGVTVDNAPNNLIGSANGGGNSITLNDIGILITGLNAMGNKVFGNEIGSSGKFSTTALGNKLSGIEVLSPSNFIGGGAPGQGNTISGNGGDGLLVQGTAATGNVIQGNKIGTDDAGTAAIPNSSNGIFVVGVANLTIGGVPVALPDGSMSSPANTISGNLGSGVYISGQFATGNKILGNYIGTDPNHNIVPSDANGNQLGNHLYGVRIDSQNNTVGGLATPDLNYIAGNTKAGVLVYSDTPTNNAINNTIIGNSIYGNGRLGIDLGGNLLNNNSPDKSVTPGPNNFQNFPVIDSATIASQVITGHLDTIADTYYYIELFKSADGQAKTDIGYARVKTDANGHVTFTFIVTGSFVAGDVLTATATRAADNVTTTNFFETSEISNTAPVLNGTYRLNDVPVNPTAANNPGTLVSSLLTNSSGVSLVSDFDTSISSIGIAVIGVTNPSTGIYRYSLDNGTTWIAFNTAAISATSAILLGPTALVQFVPNPGTLGPIAVGITYKAWDQGRGNSGDTGVDTSPGSNSVTNINGGSSVTDSFVFSSNSVTATVNVVLPPPVITNFTIDTGVVGDFITTDHNLQFTGTGPSTYYVQMFLENSSGTNVAISPQILVGANGIWNFDYRGTNLTKGTYTFFADSSIDAAGDSPSAFSAPFTITILDPITLSGGSTNATILNGQTVAQVNTTDGTDFGQVPYSASSAGPTHTFTITNTADIAATITNVTSSNSAVFQVGAVIFPNGGNHILNPSANAPYIGDMATFGITINPNALGVQTSIIDVFYTSAGQNYEYKFNVSSTILPSPPIFGGITPDTGTNNTDNITVAQNIQLFGGVNSAAPNTTLTFYRSDINNGTTSINNGQVVTVNADGSWNFDYSATTLSPGTYYFTATSTSSNPTNVSALSAPFKVIIQSIVAVSGNGNFIVSGDSVTTTADGTDFGVTPYGGSGVVETFVVTNNSQVDLTLGNLTLPAGFSLVTPVSGTVISANTSYDVQIQLDATGTDGLGNPVSIGVKTGTVNIGYTYLVAGSPVNATYDFAIKGHIAPAAPTISGILVDTGAPNDGITVDRNFSVFGGIGAAAAGTLITLTVTDSNNVTTLVGTFTTLGDGSWSIHLASPLSPGVYTFTATATDTGTNPVTVSGPSFYQVTILQEMTVTGLNNTVIPNKDTTPLATDGTSFGTVVYATAPVIHTFTIADTGNVDLTISSISIPAGYTLVNSSGVALASPITNQVVTAGSTYNVYLQLDTVGTDGAGNIVTMGIKSGTVTVNFNYPVSGPVSDNYQFNVSGQVLPAAPILTGISPDTGLPSTPDTTVAQQIHILGTSAPSAVINLYINGVLIPGITATASSTPNGSGQFTWDFDYSSVTLAPGVYNFTGTATDPSTSTVSALSTKLVVTILAEMAVKGPDSTGTVNTTPINNNDTTLSVNDGTDFGKVLYSAAPVVHVFTVTNTGNVDLTIGSVSLPSGFSLSSSISNVVVHPGGTQAISVILDTSGTDGAGNIVTMGVKTGTLVINYTYAHSTPANPTFNFKIGGQILPAPPSLVSISPDTGLNTVPIETNKTVARLITIFGTSAPSAAIAIYQDGNLIGNATASATPDGSGHFNWSFAVPRLAPGTYSFTATAADSLTPPSTPSALSTPLVVTILNEASISGNSIPIVSPNTPSVADGTDFGSLRYGDAGAPVHTFNLNNTGNVTLTVTGVNLSAAAGFLLSAPFTQFDIPANSTFNAFGSIGVKLDTTLLGLHNGTVAFSYSYNDGNSVVTGEFDVSVTGTVLPMIPVITGIVPDSSGNAGATPTGTTVARSFQLNGIAAPNTSVAVYRTDSTSATPVLIATVTPGSDGKWFVNNAFTQNLALGIYSYSATSTFTGLPTSPVSQIFTVHVIPVIGVQGLGNAILDTQSTPTVTDGTAYGNASYGDPFVVHTFKIENLGNIPLMINSITIPAGFIQVDNTGAPLTSPVSNMTIAAGDTYNLNIELNTRSLGHYSGNLVVNYDNAPGSFSYVTTHTYTFTVSGAVLPSAPVFTGILPNVGVLTAGGAVTIIQKLKLTGTAPPQTTINISRTDLSGSIGTVTSQLDGSWTFDYTGTTLAVGTYTFTASSTAPASAGGDISPRSSPYVVQVVPTINVQGKLLNIPNGSTSTTTANDTDFGILTLGEPPVVHTFVIQNPGNVDLLVNSITLPAGFTLVNSVSNVTITHGGSLAIQVRLDTSVFGPKGGFVTINYDQSVGGAIPAGAYQFAINGQVATNDSGAYVNALFNDLLGRQADPGAIDAFTPVLDNARLSTLLGVAKSLTNSTEAETNFLNAPGTGLFETLLHRSGSAGEVSYFLSAMAGGMTQQQVLASFVSSSEYFTVHSSDNTKFLQAAYQDILGRPIDAQGQASFLNALAGGASRQAVVKALIGSQEYNDRVVTLAYAQILGRATDVGGLNFWASQLANGLRIEDFRATLLASAERFQSTGSTQEAWLKGVYQLVLGRNIDSFGLAGFSKIILDGFAAARATLVTTIVNTPEFREHVIQGYYRKFLGRDGSAGDLALWANAIQNGATFNSVAIALLASPEFFNKVTSGSSTANQAWVDSVFFDVLGRKPDTSSENSFVSLLASGMSRSQVAALIVNSGENYTDLVIAAYTTMLNRTPTPAETKTWVANLQGGRRIESLAIALGSSNEFFLLVNPL